MANIYALLVGIDRYINESEIAPLDGCVADVGSIETLLTQRIPAALLRMQVLRDGQATRTGIIDGFRSHLRQAHTGDVALFYFCGHGSEEPCPTEWARLEPSGRNQTIVPVDARMPGVFDIADKELNALIHEVASTGARVVTIFDCCHSGSVTRDIDTGRRGRARMTSATDLPRSLGDYDEQTRTLYDPARLAVDGPPVPLHIAISACQSYQTAKEYILPAPDYRSRGAFSLSFEEAVRALGPTATYADLVNAIRQKVRDRAEDQTPTLYVVGDRLETELFLGGQAGRRDLTVDSDDSGHWWLSAGELDGIPRAAAGKARIAVFERGAFASDDAPTPIANAVVWSVEPDRARLRLPADTQLGRSRGYIGTIVSFGMPCALRVVVDRAAPADVATRVCAALAADTSAEFVVGQDGTSTPSVTVSAGEGGVTLHDDDPVFDLPFPLDDDGLQDLVNTCRHLARWYGVRDRRPEGSPWNDAVLVELVPVESNEATAPDDRPPLPRDAQGGIVLEYRNGEPPMVHVRIRNTSSTDLHVALVVLGAAFDCKVWFADRIPSGAVAFVAGGARLAMRIASWRDPSVRTTVDEFKIFAAPSEFVPTRFEMPPLIGPGATRTRDIERVEQDVSWGTSRLRVATRR
jgi:hypothetical protein